MFNSVELETLASSWERERPTSGSSCACCWLDGQQGAPLQSGGPSSLRFRTWELFCSLPCILLVGDGLRHLYRLCYQILLYYLSRSLLSHINLFQAWSLKQMFGFLWTSSSKCMYLLRSTSRISPKTEVLSHISVFFSLKVLCYYTSLSSEQEESNSFIYFS